MRLESTSMPKVAYCPARKEKGAPGSTFRIKRSSATSRRSRMRAGRNLSELAGKQDFYEFRITRKDLFSGKSGGLHAAGPQEEEISLFIAPAPHDPFEDAERRNPGTSRIMQVCSGCHRPPGIHSVETYRRSFIQLPRPPHLDKYDRARQEEAAMLQKWDNFSWGLLQSLMERE